MAKSKIHIKESKKGSLHKALGVPQGEKIPSSKLKVKEGDSPALKKKKIFAQNAKKWNKGQNGLAINPLEHITDPRQLSAIFENPPIVEAQKIQPNLAHPETLFKPFQRPIYQPKTSKKQTDWSNLFASGLAFANAFIPNDPIMNPVVRPLNSYNPYPNGQGSQAIAQNGTTIGGGLAQGIGKNITKKSQKPKLDEQQEFLVSYFNSPKFKERAAAYSASNPSLNNPETFAQNVSNSKYYQLPEGYSKKLGEQLGSRAWMDEFSKAVPELNIPKGTGILLDPDQGKEMGVKKENLIHDVYPHELSHKSGRPLSYNEELEFASKNTLENNKAVKMMSSKEYTDWLQTNDKVLKPDSFSQFMKQKKSGNDHDLAPDENYSDINAFRYLLNKENIYDARTQDFNSDFLKKAKQNKSLKNSFIFKRLQKTFADKDLIKLMNTIAGESGDSPTAQQGGIISGTSKVSNLVGMGLNYGGEGDERFLDVAEEKEFLLDYLNSDNYKKRLIKQGYQNPDNIIKHRSNNLLNSSYTESNAGNSQYSYEDNAVHLNKAQIANFTPNIASGKLHELSHAAGSSSFLMNANDRNYINSRNKYIGKTPKQIQNDTFTTGDNTLDSLRRNLNPQYILHDIQPEEVKADIDALRYNLFKDKIYDTKKEDFNENHLKKAKEKYKNNGIINRLFFRFLDKDLIDIMNNVAGTSNNSSTAQNGLTISNTGYKKNSKDKNKKSLRIPSNQITMRDVEFPVIGIDNLGNQQFMMPGGEYTFPGEYVDEYPIKNMQNGGALQAANIEAKRFAKSRGLANAESMYVTEVPQYVNPDGTPYKPSPSRQLPRTLPNGITPEMIETDGSNYWYNNPFTGDLVDLDPSIIRLVPNLRKPTPKDQLIAKTMQAGGIIPDISKNRKMQSGGKIQTLTEDTIQFNGPSHNNGGIDINYAGQNIEVEGGETGYFSPIDNSLNIMGNMINPLTGRKFKEDSKRLAKKEQKIDKMLDYSLDLVNESDPKDKWEVLKFNSGRVMMEGSAKKKQELLQSKEQLSTIQKAMLEHSYENGLDPEKFSKAKNGLTITFPKKNQILGKAQAGGIVDTKYSNLKTKTEALLQALYPGKDVKVIESGERDIRQQRGLRGSGASKTSVSLHNFGGARDYLIYIDGKLQNDPNIYQKTLWQAAKAEGLNTIGTWDPGHIGLVEEGKKGKSAISRLFEAYPELKGTSRYNNSLSYITDLVKTGNADLDEIRAYQALTGDINKYTPAKINYKNFSPNLAKDKMLFGENVIDRPFSPYIFNPNQPNFPGATPSQTINTPTYNFDIQNPTTIPDKPSNATNLSLTQILPEIYAAASNQEEPVFMQQYTPDLYQPYNVSFQDQLNEQNATFKALTNASYDNPSALATLAAQKYQADQSILANEFRTNQAIEQDVVNKNIALLNDAELKNLQLADTQYARQSQSKANTKAVNQAVLTSISDKLKLNELENKTLKVYENLYPNYYYNENYNPTFTGVKGQELLNWGTQPSQSSDAQTIVRTNSNGTTSVTKKYSSSLQQQLQNINLQKKTFDYTKGYMDWLKKNK